MAGGERHEAGAEELVDLPPSRLAWNRTGEQFWFHYTDRAAARSIVTTLTYRVGTRHEKAPGLYVTDIMPGARTSLQLLNALFDGTRDVERTQAAVVLADGPLQFEHVDADAWYHAAQPGSVLEMPLQIVGWAAKEDGRWLHSPSLYLP